MIDFVALQGEDFAKSASNFILQNHCLNSQSSINFGVDMGGCNNHRVEVIMSELPCLSLSHIGIPKHSAIRIPFPNSRAVSSYSLFQWNQLGTSEYFGVAWFITGRLQSLVPEDVWGIAFESESRESADD